MTSDQKKVLKAIGIYQTAKVKSDNKHTKIISPQISGVIILPRKIKNPQKYVKQGLQKLKLA